MGLLDDTTQQQYYQENNYGNYQFTSLDDIINQFMVVYVGDQKIIQKASRIDVAFHAQRAMQELSFDTFKSIKSQEITVPATLQMILPQDYVNYTKISWADSAGIKHTLYPTSKTSNPTKPQVDSNNEFLFDLNENLIPSGNLITNGNFEGGSNGWMLNQNGNTGAVQFSSTTTEVNAGATNYGFAVPDVGWFYGFNGNAIGGYNLPRYQTFRQSNIPIISGEKYEITYTISEYVSGEYIVVIIDENGDWSRTANVAANGTFTETLTAGNTGATYLPQNIYLQNNSTALGNAVIDNISVIRVGDDETSKTWSNYKSATPSENNTDDYQDDTYWPAGGERYGLDPQHAQVNGSFYIDQQSGKIHFSSNISGKTVVLDYISDGLGTDAEMQVHKFAEEAMYKSILCAIMSAKANVGGRQLAYYKKDKFAAIRTAKLRLSNIKLEELTQILRGKSKHIKH